jgi:hypothetical protein
MHCLPFKNRSRAIRPKERRRECLHAHHRAQGAQGPWRTRGRGNQDKHQPHGNPNGTGRIESDRRREVLPSNRRHTIWGNDASTPTTIVKMATSNAAVLMSFLPEQSNGFSMLQTWFATQRSIAGGTRSV